MINKETSLADLHQEPESDVIDHACDPLEIAHNALVKLKAVGLPEYVGFDDIERNSVGNNAEIIELYPQVLEPRLLSDLEKPGVEFIDSNDTDEKPSHLYFRDFQRIEAARLDQGHFNSLLDEYQVLLRIITGRYFLPGGNHDDLMQEATIGFYQAVRDYDGMQSSFRTFVEIVIRRQIITAVKTATRFKHKALNTYVSFAHTPGGHEDYSDEMTLGDSLPSQSPSVEETLESTEALAGLVSFLKSNNLSSLEADALRLFLTGESYESIAAELEVDKKAIDNSLQRVKRKLLQQMAA